MRPDVSVIHPAFDTADHEHPLETVTMICPSPPLESTVTEVGVTKGEQVSADGGAGVTGGWGVGIGVSSGGVVGSGVEPPGEVDTGGLDSGGVEVVGGGVAAGVVPA